MSHNNQNVSDYHAGDALDLIVTVEVADEGTSPATLIDQATDIEWYLQETLSDPINQAMLTKTLVDGIETPGEANDLQTGQFMVQIETDDTDGLGGQTVHHRARITDADGRRSTLFTGSFTIDH